MAKNLHATAKRAERLLRELNECCDDLVEIHDRTRDCLALRVEDKLTEAGHFLAAAVDMALKQEAAT